MNGTVEAPWPVPETSRGSHVPEETDTISSPTLGASADAPDALSATSMSVPLPVYAPDEVPSDSNLPDDVEILVTEPRHDKMRNLIECFKSTLDSRSKKVEDMERFQIFNSKADEFKKGIDDTLSRAPEETEEREDSTHLQAKFKEHQAFKAEVVSHRNKLDALNEQGLKMTKAKHFTSTNIHHRLIKLDQLYALLTQRMAEKGRKLLPAQMPFEFNKNYTEVVTWINDVTTHVVTTDESGFDLKEMEELLKKFRKFQKDMPDYEFRVDELTRMANTFIREKDPGAEAMRKKEQEVKSSLQHLKEQAQLRKGKLFCAYQIRRFSRDADETIASI